MRTAHPPALSGVCTGLVVQEYWWAGALCAPANVTYLQLDHGQWHRFFIDAGDPFWSVVDAPDVWHTTPEDEHHYPQREIAAESGLLGRVIEDAAFVETPPVYAWRLRFSGGATLTLRDEDDHLTLSIDAHTDRTPADRRIRLAQEFAKLDALVEQAEAESWPPYETDSTKR